MEREIRWVHPSMDIPIQVYSLPMRCVRAANHGWSNKFCLTVGVLLRTLKSYQHAVHAPMLRTLFGFPCLGGQDKETIENRHINFHPSGCSQSDSLRIRRGQPTGADRPRIHPHDNHLDIQLRPLLNKKSLRAEQRAWPNSEPERIASHATNRVQLVHLGRSIRKI